MNKDQTRTFKIKVELTYTAYDKMDACDYANDFIQNVRGIAYPHLELVKWSLDETTKARQEAVRGVQDVHDSEGNV